jgi:hypothetical protein
MPKEQGKNFEEHNVKAGALLCPVCCIEFRELEIDFEFDGKIIHNVKMLQCPECKKELFTQEQHEIIAKGLCKTNNSSKQITFH